MKIITHGKYFDPFPLFVHCACGCEYEAEKTDGMIRTSLCPNGQTTFSVRCPECGDEYRHRIAPRFQYN